MRGRALLAEPLLNKGTAFNDDERRALGLEGLLPDSIESIDEQLVRTQAEFERMHDDLERHVYLRSLQDHNEVLFYRFIGSQLEATLPIVYTPTVGLATQQFSRIFRRSRGLVLSYRNRERMAEQFASIESDVDVVVVTDGERILGLGDQGAGGMAIPIGKLSLYTAFGGIDPSRTLPIMLDVGTNNPDRLADPEYLGWRNERISGVDYDSFVDQFVSELTARFPNVLLQWEDFAQQNASRLLDHYRPKLLTFNDDIQGTAAVALAAIWGALRSTGRNLAEQRFCIAGAGSAGTGIAAMLKVALEDAGVARPLEQIFMLDSKGLIHDGRDNLKPHQTPLAHPFAAVAEWASGERPPGLETVVAESGATVLVGVTGRPGMFTSEIVASMLKSTDQPVVMPLSNPTSQAEATPAELIDWTNGQAIIATGSPFAPVAHNGVTHHFSQANNVYVFPGLGLGAVAVGASQVSDRMLMIAAQMVSAADDPGPVTEGVLPSIERVSEVSSAIAIEVAKSARDEGLAPDLTDDEIADRVASLRWSPRYQPLV